jgi:hypothetical protein
MRRAVATRLRTRRLLVKSTLPPLTFFSGQRPSQDAKAFRNRETSVPISHRPITGRSQLVDATPLINWCCIDQLSWHHFAGEARLWKM